MTLRMRLPQFTTLLCLTCAVALGAWARAEDAPQLADLATFAQSSVDIGKAPHAQHFDVWIADTPERQSQGLMYVRDLPAVRGMLFIESAPKPAVFWMKNTYVSLDMLFVGPDHRIVKIAERTPPLSLATIASDTPVIAVLEIKAGESARRGIHVGDRMSWP